MNTGDVFAIRTVIVRKEPDGRKTVSHDDYVILAEKYEALRRMYGESVEKFFISAQRLSTELTRRGALMTRYDRLKKKHEDDREAYLNLSYMNDRLDEQLDAREEEISEAKDIIQVLREALNWQSKKDAEDAQKKQPTMIFGPTEAAWPNSEPLKK
jgi:uncharacterized coiled-coil DUF342 family protein